MLPTTPPKATIAEQLADRTRWLVQWPSTRKACYATTFADSDDVLIETKQNRRPVAEGRAKRLMPTVRRLIDIARAEAQ
jgi:hypothetical protein